jgi:cytochrome c-type biogenesis protein CcmH/NrfG
MKYVTIAVGLAVVVCVIAILRTAGTSAEWQGYGSASSVPGDVAVATKPAEVAAAAAEANAANPWVLAAVSEVPVASSAPTIQPWEVAVASVSAAAPSKAPPASAPEESQSDAVQAGKNKKEAQAALERGQAADSIDAGERSVALDPSDGEAWLILGAAYQSKGDIKAARRCFRSCIELGKRGDRSECLAMLR